MATTLSSAITLRHRVSIPSGLLCQKIDGEALLLEQERGHYYGLDEVGTHMFELMRQHRELAVVKERLLAEYEVGEEALERDLLELAGKLREHGLVEIREPEVAG